MTVSHLPVLPTITESKRTTSSSITAHTTPCETLHNLLQHSSPPSLSFTIRLGERQSRQENNALKFTESPKVTFSGSGKEPSVLIPSLGFLPELSDAQVKANKAPRPLCLALLPSSLFSFYCPLLPTYNCSLLPPFPVFIHETSIKGYD